MPFRAEAKGIGCLKGFFIVVTILGLLTVFSETFRGLLGILGFALLLFGLEH